MSTPFVIVGLGNPGSQYSKTRHNLGFDVVDSVSEYLRCSFIPGKGEFFYASANISDKKIYLLKPTTYMNNSGVAVKEFVDRLEVGTENILIIYDDFHLAIGSLRIRLKGSDGGHNGMASVIMCMNTEEIPRLRCGIKGLTVPSEKQQISQYVLESFDIGERIQVRSMVTRARDAALSVAREGIHVAMNHFNT